MKLTLEEIKSVTVGAVSVRREEDGEIHFYKLTDRQIEAFRALSEGFYRGGLTTTGVRIEFVTDSPWIKYRMCKNGEATERTVDFSCVYESGEEAPFSLIFPSHGVGTLTYLEIKDGHSFRPISYERKLLFIGDSLTQGWHSSRDELSFAWRTSKHFHANSVIQGIGGTYYHPSTLDRWDFDPETVIVAYGTNDASRAQSVEEVRNHCRAYFERLKELYPDATLCVITPPWRQDYDCPRPYGHVQDISDCIRAEAEAREGIHVIDGMTLMPHDPALFADDLHPNDLGFACYAQALNHALEALER